MQRIGVTVAEHPLAGATNLRADAADRAFAAAVAEACGVEPPVVPNTAARGLLCTVLWLGPDEWLAASETVDGAELAQRLRGLLGGRAAAVTDVSDARILYRLSGRRAAEVLDKGVSVDLHPCVFVPGRCAQTLMGRVPVILHRAGSEPGFDLYVARSLADYAWAWLDEASREFS